MAKIETSDGYIIEVDFQSPYFENRIKMGKPSTVKVKWNRNSIYLWLGGVKSLKLKGNEADRQHTYQTFVYNGLVISKLFETHSQKNYYESLARRIENPHRLIQLLARDEYGLHVMGRLISPKQLFALKDKSIVPQGMVFKILDIKKSKGKSEAWWLKEMEKKQSRPTSSHRLSLSFKR